MNDFEYEEIKSAVEDSIKYVQHELMMEDLFPNFRRYYPKLSIYWRN